MESAVLSQITRAALPVYTRVVPVYVHGFCIDNGLPQARAFCGVWFYESCSMNTQKELMAATELKQCTINTAALGAVFSAIQQCERLISEWPNFATGPVVPPMAMTPSSYSSSSSPLASSGHSTASSSSATAIEMDQEEEEEEKQEDDINAMTSNGHIKLFSAKTIAPFVPESQREPSGSARRPVVIVIFTDSEYVTKALVGGPSKVKANRHLILPLQVLTRDFNVFVLRCPSHSNGIVQAQRLARQVLHTPKPPAVLDIVSPSVAMVQSGINT